MWFAVAFLAGCSGTPAPAPAPAPAAPAPAPAPPPAPTAVLPKPPPGAVRVATVECEAGTCNLVVTIVAADGAASPTKLVALPLTAPPTQLYGTWAKGKLALSTGDTAFVVDFVKGELLGAPVALPADLAQNPALALDPAGVLHLCGSNPGTTASNGDSVTITVGEWTDTVKAADGDAGYAMALHWSATDGKMNLVSHEGKGLPEGTRGPVCTTDFPKAPAFASFAALDSTGWAAAEGADADALKALGGCEDTWLVAGNFAGCAVAFEGWSFTHPFAARSAAGWVAIPASTTADVHAAVNHAGSHLLVSAGTTTVLADATGKEVWKHEGPAFLWPIDGGGAPRPDGKAAKEGKGAPEGKAAKGKAKAGKAKAKAGN